MTKAKLYNRYPLSSILVYNGTTILHFMAGGLILSYSSRFWGSFGIILGLLYISLSLVEMYILMPLQVCRNCVYFKLENGLCISGLNVLSRRFAREGNPSNFAQRAQGLFCPNNLYIVSLAIPILGGIPLLIAAFSLPICILEIVLFILLATRFLYIIPRMACVHCSSKFICPQAGQMGVREK